MKNLSSLKESSLEMKITYTCIVILKLMKNLSHLKKRKHNKIVIGIRNLISSCVQTYFYYFVFHFHFTFSFNWEDNYMKHSRLYFTTFSNTLKSIKKYTEAKSCFLNSLVRAFSTLSSEFGKVMNTVCCIWHSTYYISMSSIISSWCHSYIRLINPYLCCSRKYPHPCLLIWLLHLTPVTQQWQLWN